MRSDFSAGDLGKTGGAQPSWTVTDSAEIVPRFLPGLYLRARRRWSARLGQKRAREVRGRGAPARARGAPRPCPHFFVWASMISSSM